MKKIIFALAAVLAAAALLFTSCGSQGGQGHSSQEGPVTLVLASFQDNPVLGRQVELFNRSHDDYQIEIQKYTRWDSAEEDGRARMQREIISGKGPDLIDFGSDYATGDIVGCYTEDLYPYLESGLENPEDYFRNIWDAFRYKDGLYAVPTCFTLSTFAGINENLGGRSGWNIQEMMDCYEERRDEMILYPGEQKIDVFGTILNGSMEYYIDWENGLCSFDGKEFRQVLEFANSFPDSLNLEEDFSVKQTFLDGRALLLPLKIADIYDICNAGFIFGGSEISYIGFPVEGKSGTIINVPGPVLAISIGSGHKEVCWEFITQFLGKEYQGELDSGLPVCRSVLEEKLRAGMETEYSQDQEGKRSPIAKAYIRIEGEDPIEVYQITQAQADTLLHLIESAGLSTSNDRPLYNAVIEEARRYFAGERTLEETLRNIQGRASIYVNERIQ